MARGSISRVKRNGDKGEHWRQPLLILKPSVPKCVKLQIFSPNPLWVMTLNRYGHSALLKAFSAFIERSTMSLAPCWLYNLLAITKQWILVSEFGTLIGCQFPHLVIGLPGLGNKVKTSLIEGGRAPLAQVSLTISCRGMTSLS